MEKSSSALVNAGRAASEAHEQSALERRRNNMTRLNSRNVVSGPQSLGLPTNVAVHFKPNNAKPGKPLPPSAYGDPEPHRSALAKYVNPEDRPVVRRSWSRPFPHMRGDW